MNRSDNINELTAALAKAQGEIKGAVKDATNPHFRSSYADLQSVWDAIREPLSKNALCVMQFPSTSPDGEIIVETMLSHDSGQWVSSELRMHPAQDTPQAFGSAITYARRYALQAVAGVAPMDDDGEAAEGRGGAPVSSEKAMERTDHRRESSARKQAPAEPVEIKGRWQDVVCHIGKANGPIKGKMIGALPENSKTWLLTTLREKDQAALPAADRRLLAALCMWEAENAPKDKIVETPPANGEREPITALLGMLEWNEIPHEVFWKVAHARNWTDATEFSGISDEHALRIQENLEKVIEHCQTAIKEAATEPAK
jgi:hypothetical protein